MSDNRKISELTVTDLKNVVSETVRETSVELLSLFEDMKANLKKLSEENGVIKMELEKIRSEKDLKHNQLIALENQMKKKNVIFKGLKSEICFKNAVKKVCTEKLNFPSISIKSSKKIYDNKGKMGVIVELDSEDIAEEIFKRLRNLAGTNISMERDLNINTSQRLSVRNDKLRIADKWISWNKSKELVCGRENGASIINSLCDDRSRDVIKDDSYFLFWNNDLPYLDFKSTDRITYKGEIQKRKSNHHEIDEEDTLKLYRSKINWEAVLNDIPLYNKKPASKKVTESDRFFNALFQILR